MPHRYTSQTRSEIKKLFLSGWSLSKLSNKFGISRNTIACWAAKGKWTSERAPEKQPLEVLGNGQVVSEDPEVDAVRKIVHDCRLAALRCEAQIARALAEKSLKAAQALQISDLDGVVTSQQYRERLWSSSNPPHAPGGMRITFDGDPAAVTENGERNILILHYAHERVEQIERKEREARVLPGEDGGKQPPAGEDHPPAA